MPLGLTSAAKEAPKVDMKALVEAYRTEKGFGMAAAAEEVYTKHPFRCLSSCVWGYREGELCVTAKFRVRGAFL